MDSIDLPWLPAPPADLSAQVRALRRQSPPDLARLRALSTTRLDLGQLTVLARACQQAADAQPAQVLRLRVLANSTVDLWLPALMASAPRHGLLLTVDTGPFGSWMQEALDPNSATRLQPPQAVLLALDETAFHFPATPGDSSAATGHLTLALGQLQAAVSALQCANVSMVLVQTLVNTGGPLFGHLDGQLPGTRAWLIDQFNRHLREQPLPGTLLLDTAALAAQVGITRWHDRSLWQLGKVALSARAMPLYAENVCRLLMAARGLARKCLVLDLDNTVWGGVIGDDGLGGIVLGQGSAAGEAHLAVQHAALALRERGIVLAVASKNDDAIARLPFRDHPDMVLREDHIAVFQANWHDKASNLRAIARTLNIGTDALVLLDDNPAERHQVRNALPEVAVPELPDSPEHFAATLMAAGYFESVLFTPEDRQRAGQYQAQATRSALLDTAADLDSHLQSLAMVARCSPFDADGRARITQLINKTNQFNLSTRRRSEAEVEALERDRSAFTMQLRLNDRFGDNGMVCVVICFDVGDDWLIDTWLMSCRVLNRRLEHAVLNFLSARAQANGKRRLIADYLPTAKNGPVSGLLPGLGFELLGATPGAATGATRWVLPLASASALASPVDLHTVGY